MTIMVLTARVIAIEKEDTQAVAIYLDVERIEVNEFSARYRYTTVDDREGQFNFDLSTGEPSLIFSIPGEIENRLFLRASRKVWLGWKEGALPEKTYWAS